MTSLKILLSLSLFITASPSIAGQEGSGGNICDLKRGSFLCNRTRTSCMYIEEGYRVLEELQYPGLASEQQTFRGNDLKKFYSSDLSPGERYVDLTLSTAGLNSLEKLNSLRQNNLKLGDALIGLFGLLKKTHVRETRFDKFYEAGLDVDSICIESTMQAAIKTTKAGKIVLSLPAWYDLAIESQEVLLIHETLRFAQLFTPWFKKVSNQELQEITMLIYSGKFNKLENKKFIAELNEHSFD